MLSCSRAADVAPVPTRLAFGMVGGPLLAIVGLCGGAGVSTLAHLIAAAAARESSVPVIAMDTAGPTAGLAVYANAQSRDSMIEIAAALDGDAPLEGPLFATTADGLRVLATGPRLPASASAAALDRVLADARAAHGLTVVDCASLTGDAARAALRAATDVVWMLPATSCALTCARRMLCETDVSVEGCELVVARHDALGRRAPLTGLADLAAHRRARLVLMAHIPNFDELTLDGRLAHASVTLTALAGATGRPPA